jgi:hypothetical protein
MGLPTGGLMKYSLQLDFIAQYKDFLRHYTVSLELVYGGCDFGDHHSDNSRAILDYNSL